MDSFDSEATDSSEQSTRPVFYRPSRSRERRFRKKTLSPSKKRQNKNFGTSKNQEEALEMTDIFIESQETLQELKFAKEEVTSRRKSSPVPTFNLDKIDSIEELVNPTGRPKMRKPSPSILLRDYSGHFRRMSSATASSTQATRTESDPDMERFSSTVSVQRQKSELSQILSQLIQPKAKGIKGALKNFRRWVYNKQNKTFCGRTCRSWMYLLIYALLYLIFQMTFTLFWLYISLLIINNTDNWPDLDKTELQTYAQNNIGLSAVPASEGSLPLIWYKSKDPNDYKKYVDAIEFLYKSRTKNATELKSLGPCSKSPYGYGEAPCVLVRINKQLGWSAKALLPNSTLTSSAPPDVKSWIQTKQMLWLHCAGYNQYDREHVNKIVYYPDPPGINPNVFPLNMDKDSPLIGIQLIDFTKGISIGIQCKLWYDTGTSAVEFVLYVLPEDVSNGRRASSKVC